MSHNPLLPKIVSLPPFMSTPPLSAATSACSAGTQALRDSYIGG
jgi:hypothetical protein